MRAIVCDTWGGEELLKLKNLPSPAPREDELVIKVHAAGVNFPDTLIIRNLYQVKPELPFTPGNEVAGAVISAGAKISKFAVGDRVLALIGIGAFCEEVAVKEKSCTKIPDQMEFAAAAGFMLAYGTSWHAVLPLLKGASIVGVQYGHFFNFEPAQNAAGVAEMFTWFKEKKIRPLVSKTYTLEETPIALADMGARKVTGNAAL
jgi:NADPH:quinone reductase-like Zn-dependent oxidoreductase